MIVPRGPQLKRMVQYVGKPLLWLAVYDVVVVFAFKVLHWEWVALPHIPLSLFGAAIGSILGFRNQSVYGRWWEARILWGAIVNNSRSWGRQVVTTVRSHNQSEGSEVKATQRQMIYHQIAFVHALRQHLRKLEPWEELGSLLPETELNALRDQKNVPMTLQEQMGGLLQEWEERGWVGGWQWRAMDERLNDLTDAQGGAEGIKNTPMPKQYDHFPRLFVHICCFLLPLALWDGLHRSDRHWWASSFWRWTRSGATWKTRSRTRSMTFP